MTQHFQERLPLSRHATDRAAHRRNEPDLIEQLLADAQTRILVLVEGRTAVVDGALRSFSVTELSAALPLADHELLYLGETTVSTVEEPAGTSYLAVAVQSELVAELVAAESWVELRNAGQSLSDRDAGLFTQALALTNWHRSHGFAPRTGAPTVPAQAGWVRLAHDDDTVQVFPRTDPAVIVLVTDGADRILLGNNALWESNRYSLLAGYVEPGESLESAVIREVWEESGLAVVNPVYRGSQPWPFPASLMLGFTAELTPGADPEAHAADGDEIRHLRWFTRDEVRNPGDDVILPGAASIARALLEEWLGESIPQNVPFSSGPR